MSARTAGATAPSPFYWSAFRHDGEWQRRDRHRRFRKRAHLGDLFIHESGSRLAHVEERAARRLADAIELADLAERMVRARLRREHPELSESELEARVLAWLHDRPGAVEGDAEGRVVQLGRRS